MNERQKKGLIELFTYLKNNNRYFSNILNFDKIPSDDILKIYYDFNVVGKKEIINNIKLYISKEFCSCFSNESEMCQVLFDVQTLTNNHDKIVKNENRSWNIEYTTGSSGKPFPIVKTEREKIIEAMYLFKKRREIYSDASLNNGFLFLHPNRPDVRKLDLWKFNFKDMFYIVNEWLLNPPKWLFATPLVYYKYAEFILQHNLLDAFQKNKLQFIEYTSQPILPEQSKVIDLVYNTMVINNYGSREFWNIAYQCIHGNLHLNDQFLIVDLIDEDGNVIKEYNKKGQVIITNLISKDMPLVKYYLGDCAKIIQSNCLCGCKSDIIELVEEKENEKLKNTEHFGGKVFRRVMRGIFFHDYIEDINQIKIVQDADFHLTVYLDKTTANDLFFEERFINRTKSIVPEIYKFKIDFVYEYPFLMEQYRFKESIFKSVI